METNTSNFLQTEISQQMSNPAQLETLYRKNKTSFRDAFNAIYPNLKENVLAQGWNERLNYKQEDFIMANKNELLFVVLATFIAGMIAKIPDFTGIAPDYFFPRNISLVVFPMLIAFFAWRQQLRIAKLILPVLAMVISTVYINTLPDDPKSDTLILACIHLPLLLWTVLGYSFAGNELSSNAKRISFLRYNGDLLVMCALLALSAGFFSAITFGLFELIDINIEDFFGKYIAVFGAPAIPILGTYLVQNNPQLVNKISPLIARIFTPLVFVMLLVFLAAILVTAKDPYNDREFLLIFNVLLIGVMALIVFSVTEATKTAVGKFNIFSLFGLSVLTIIANGIALSAIAFRVFEFGITPNRLAVMGGNLLIFINLLIVSVSLFKALKGRFGLEKVENSIAAYLPIYGFWTVVVIYLFPVIFGFR
jgi:hypothetical protein